MALTVRNKNKIVVVSGYVVNVHDAINFDIDLSFTPAQRYTYRHVITNEYEYKEESSEEEGKLGKAYRCRVKGIQLSSSSYRGTREKTASMKKATTDMEQMINRSNGWVVCAIDSADVYNRLLVDLIDPALFPEKYVSYRDMLFARYPSLFTEYIPQPHSPKRRRKQHRY